MKTVLIYLVSVVLSIFVIIGILHYGKGLQAPPALADHWIGAAPAANAGCQLLEAKSYALTLKQSGENLSLVWAEEPHWELHGKIDRSGEFKLRGKLSGQKQNDCPRAKLAWVGKADQQSLSGILSVDSEACSLCPSGLLLKAEPKRD